MRFRPASRAVLAGACLIAPWAVADRPARADILVGSTLIPTSSVVTTSTYLPTSFGSSSIFPTSYIPTSYVVPTSTILPTSTIFETGSSVYYPTTYVTRARGGLFRPRRFVERTSYYGTSTGFVTPTAYYSPAGYVTPTTYFSSSYVPTAYVASTILPTSYVVPTVATSTILPTTYLSSSYVPTSYVVDNGLIATVASTSSTPACCDTAPAPTVNPTRTVAPTRSMTAPNPGNMITSTPATGESSRSTERPPSATVSPSAGEEVPPPSNPAVPPAPTKPAETTPPRPPETIEKPDDVTVPNPGILKPSLDEGAARTSYKPATYKPVRNILQGRVVSFETGRAEEAVPVVLSSRTNVFTDRTTLTNAYGEFSISLPDGDWAVKVTMPSGTVYTVGRSVTASGGQVVDRNGRSVGEFVITR